MDNTDSTTKTYTHRFLARIVIEAQTPLAVGSGEKDLLTDALVATDVNGLPYLPGTSIAGVLRSMLTVGGAMTGAEIDSLFGFQKGAEGKGSEIIFSEARIISGSGAVVDGLDAQAINADPLLSHYQLLPIRQHVRIDGKGTAADKGLFNEQVVFPGTRFCFEMEMVSDGSDTGRLKEVLGMLRAVDFRIGGGTRSGFGKIRVVRLDMADLDLTLETDLEAYLGKSSSLDSDFWIKSAARVSDTMKDLKAGKRDVTCYRLELTPDSFFFFGSGFGDDEADMTPVKARKAVWKDWTGADGRSRMEGRMLDDLVLIPGSSLKGALAHRTAFHWNRMNGIFSDDLVSDLSEATGKHNDAVSVLFGTEGDGPESEITRGNVIFSDIIGGRMTAKMLNHVSIDRFTGGALEGALFGEKAAYDFGGAYTTDIIIDEAGLARACVRKWGEEGVKANADRLKEALTAAIDDLCKGMLPLGGGVNRGNGIFTGKYTISKDQAQ